MFTADFSTNLGELGAIRSIARSASSTVGRGVRSLGEPLKQLAILLDDAPHARLESGIPTAPLDRIPQRFLHRFVEALALGSSERLGVGREFLVEAD